MEEYIKNIKPVDVRKSRRKHLEAEASSKDYNGYRSLARSFIWAGNGLVPQASYMGSSMQQMATWLKVKHIVEAHRMVSEMKAMRPLIMDKKLDKVTREPIWTFSDVSHNISTRKSYGQTGTIAGLFIEGLKFV